MLLTNNITNFCSEVSTSRVAYTFDVKGLDEVEKTGRN